MILAQDGGDPVRPAAGLDALLGSLLPLPGDEPRTSRIVGVPVRTSCYIRGKEHVCKLRRTGKD
jgi:hypothetical protein